MTPEFVVSIGNNTIEVVLMVGAPLLICTMVVGLLVSIFQAVTQIQEMTMTFVPKIIVVFLALLALLPWMMDIMVRYTSDLIINIPSYIG